MITTNLPITTYSFFSDKEQLDPKSFCGRNLINIKFNVELTTKEIDYYNLFSEKNFNVMNRTDTFFNDRCTPFTSGDQDVTVKERKVSYYVNPNEKCKVDKEMVCKAKFDKHVNLIECECKGINKSKRSNLEDAFSIISESNLVLLQCYERFLKANMFANSGFLACVSLLISFSYLAFYLQRKTIDDLNTNKKFQYVRNDVVSFDRELMDEEIFFKEVEHLKAMKTSHLTGRRAEKKYQMLLRQTINSMPFKKDLERLSAQSQLKYDKRSTYEFFYDSLMKNHPITYAFRYKSVTVPVIYRVFLLMTEIHLGVCLNAAFIEDALIESLNENNSFIENLFNEIPNSIFSVFTTKIVMTALSLALLFDAKKVYKLQTRLIKLTDYLAAKGFDSFMRVHRISEIIFMIAVATINLGCLYFIVIYNEVFKNSRSIWINGIVMSWVIEFCIVEVFPSFYLTVTRFLALRYQKAIVFFKFATYFEYVKEILIA